MRNKDYITLGRQEQENLLMPEIIKILQKLGGKATRAEIKKEMRNYVDFLSGEQIDEIRISKQSGKPYNPFVYSFNFSLNNLRIAGYVNYNRQSGITLTELGRKVDVTENFYKIVRSKTAPHWEIQHKNRKDKVENENIEDDFEPSESPWRIQLESALEKMSPKKFELFARALVKEMGVVLDETIGIQYVADGGLDGFGYITSDEFRTTRVAIQAKRWKGTVSSPEIDKFRGAMDKHNAEYGIFITTAKFSRGAVQASRVGTRVITLIDGDMISDLVAKYKLYVQEVVTYELDSFYFEKD